MYWVFPDYFSEYSSIDFQKKNVKVSSHLVLYIIVLLKEN